MVFFAFAHSPCHSCSKNAGRKTLRTSVKELLSKQPKCWSLLKMEIAFSENVQYYSISSKLVSGACLFVKSYNASDTFIKRFCKDCHKLFFGKCQVLGAKSSKIFFVCMNRNSRCCIVCFKDKHHNMWAVENTLISNAIEETTIIGQLAT